MWKLKSLRIDVVAAATQNRQARPSMRPAMTGDFRPRTTADTRCLATRGDAGPECSMPVAAAISGVTTSTRLRRAGTIAALALVVMASGACGTSTPKNMAETHSATAPSTVESGDADQTYATTAQVLDAVKAAEGLQSVPASVAAALSTADWATPGKPVFDCHSVDNPTDAEIFGQCAYGDASGKKLMVLYGDSHTDMWSPSLNRLAQKYGWKLRVFGMHACPAPDLQYYNPATNTSNEKCDEFHSTALAAIQALHPDLVVVSSASAWQLADQSRPTSAQWQDGLVATLNKLAQPGTRLAVIGDMPSWSTDDERCLAAHVDAVQECSAAVSDATSRGNFDAEQAAAGAVGALFISTVPWVCADRCEPVIADTRVFQGVSHLSRSYVLYLTGALGEAMRPALA
jgi:hypothetical protein